MADLSFLQKLLQGNNVYDYSKSPEDNGNQGSALQSIQDVTKQGFNQQFPDLYVRNTPEEQNQLDAHANIPELTPPIDKPAMIPRGPATPPSYGAPSSPMTPVKEQTNLQDILAKITTKAPQDTEMSNAQGNARDMVSALLMTRGANKIGTSLAGVEPDAQYGQGAIDLVNKKVSDLKDLRKSQADLQDQEFKKRNQAIGEIKADYDIKKAQFEQGDKEKENDPNSDLSKAFRDYARGYVRMAGANIQIPDGLSYADLNKQMGTLGNVVSAKMAQDARRDIFKLKAMDSADKKKTEGQIKYEDTLEKATNPMKMRAGEFGKTQAKINQAERLESLSMDKNGVFLNLTPEQMNELASGLDVMISNNPSISGREHLTPESKSKWIAKHLQWITDKPRGADQQAFVKNMMDTVHREKETAQWQVKRAQIQSLKSYNTLHKLYPETYQNQLMNLGISGDDFDKYEAERTGKPHASNKHADLNNMSDTELDETLKQLKGR